MKTNIIYALLWLFPLIVSADTVNPQTFDPEPTGWELQAAGSATNMVEYATSSDIYERPSAQQIIDDLKEKNPQNRHPRILATAETFDYIQSMVATDPYAASWYNNVKNSADSTLNADVPAESGDHLRSLVLNRILNLGMMYQMTGEEKYAQRAWDELEAVAGFEHWEAERQMLTTGYILKAFAIGYDWFYDYWSEEQKEIIRSAAIEKGLTPGLIAYRNPGGYQYQNSHWVLGNNNWNVTVNGGLSMMALAIGDEAQHEEMAGEILESALRSLENFLPEYAPDGAGREGPSYWYFAAQSLVEYMGSLDTALGTDYGIGNTTGLSTTGFFPVYMSGSEGFFNWGNGHQGNLSRNIPAELFWFAGRYDTPELANIRLFVIGESGGIRDLLWYRPEGLESRIDLPLDGQFGQTESVGMRSRWDFSNEVYVGFKGGYNNEVHGSLSTGTFVLDALGERWITQLGPEDYSVPGYWDYSLAGQRWTYYRMRAEGNNTLVINPGFGPDQHPFAFSEIVKFEAKPRGAFSIVDMTPAYASRGATDVKRGVMLGDYRRHVIVQDEIRTENPSELFWFVHTRADVEIHFDARSATLMKNGKELLAQILSPADAAFEVVDARPLPSSPNPPQANRNEEFRKLQINLSGIEDVTLSVMFVPLVDDEPGEIVLPEVSALNDWYIPDGDLIPMLDSITIDGNEIHNFQRNRFEYTINVLPGDGHIPQVDAQGYHDIAIIQATEVPGTAIINVVNSDDASFTSQYLVHFKPDFDFRDWQRLYFSDEQLADPSISGMHADPDRDGLSNFVEYAIGSNPLVPASVRPFEIIVVDNLLHYRYRIRAGVPDVEFSILRSSNLKDWAPLQLFDNNLISREDGIEVRGGRLPFSQTQFGTFYLPLYESPLIGTDETTDSED